MLIDRHSVESPPHRSAFFRPYGPSGSIPETARPPISPRVQTDVDRTEVILLENSRWRSILTRPGLKGQREYGTFAEIPPPVSDMDHQFRRRDHNLWRAAEVGGFARRENRPRNPDRHRGGRQSAPDFGPFAKPLRFLPKYMPLSPFSPIFKFSLLNSDI